jgi:hypothetical protein
MAQSESIVGPKPHIETWKAEEKEPTEENN